MKVVIVGNGVWGNALYSVVTQNNNDVTIAKRGEKISADVIILAAPTSSIRDILPLISFLNKKIIINTSKGIEQITHLFPHEIVREKFEDTVEYFTLMGPSFAEEVTQKMPTIVNLGYKKEMNNDLLNLLQTKEFRVIPVQGVEALEIAGALKNVYAIACGIAAGLGYKINTKTQLIVMAIEELKALYKGIGVHEDEKINPELIGDLILTCTNGSRNFNFGALLPTHTMEKALEQINSTVEGCNTAKSIDYLEKKGNIQLPVARFVKETLEEDNPQSILERFNKLLS